MSHRRASLLLALVLAAFFGPMLARGEVIFAHDNAREVGLPGAEPPEHRENRKFSDQSSVYLPLLHQQLRGDHAGWISLWNPHPELGRPTAHLGGLSKAFVVTRALSFLSDDPFHVYTWLAGLAAAATCVFGYLLCRSLSLRPAACLTGALGLGLGVVVPYWLTFAIFVWGLAWTLALLWLVTLASRRATAPRLLGIVFALHALLLSGYPQQIVWHAWMLAGWTVLCLARAEGGPRRRLGRALGIGAAIVAGALATAPVYADLAADAARSARLDVEPEFFLSVLPPLGSWSDAGLLLLRLVDGFWLGDVIDPAYPTRFNGLCFTPLVAALLLLSFAGGLPRRLWPAQAFVLFALATTLVPALYRFGIERLGLSLSRFFPLSGAFVPAVVLAAVAADRVLAGRVDRRIGAGIVLALAAAMAAAAAVSPYPVAPGFVAAGALVLGGTLAFVWTRSALVLVLLAVGGAFHYGFRLPLARPPGEIHLDSPLVELVRRATADGSRFAWVAAGNGLVLPPNQESLLGLRSVHTYNSLSSGAYQRWASGVSERGAKTHGRHFHALSSWARLDAAELDLAGIGLFLASDEAGPPPSFVRPVGRGAFAPREPPRLEAQLVRFDVEDGGAGGSRGWRIGGRLDAAAPLAVERLAGHDDLLRFRTTRHEAPSLLFVSQQHHPSWTARVDGTPAPTGPVNGFYQGVLVPPGTREVELRFLPRARWSWVPQAAFAVAAVLVLALRARGVRTAGADRPE